MMPSVTIESRIIGNIKVYKVAEIPRDEERLNPIQRVDTASQEAKRVYAGSLDSEPVRHFSIISEHKCPRTVPIRVNIIKPVKAPPVFINSVRTFHIGAIRPKVQVAKRLGKRKPLCALEALNIKERNRREVWRTPFTPMVEQSACVHQLVVPGL
jgi:hypothetical protein